MVYVYTFLSDISPGSARTAYCGTTPGPGPYCVLRHSPGRPILRNAARAPDARPVLRTAVRAPGPACTAYCSTGPRPGPYCVLQYGPQARPVLRTAVRAPGPARTAYCSTGPRPGWASIFIALSLVLSSSQCVQAHKCRHAHVYTIVSV